MAKRKVPVVMQMEARECGAACLAMILAYHGRWVPLEQVRQECGVSRDGSKALNILQAARGYGMEARGYTYSAEGIRSANLPCIIFWNFNHFVVLKGFKGEYALINDPARGAVKVPLEEFDRAFTGVALCVQPGEGFEPGGKQASVGEFVRQRLHGMVAPLVFVALTALIASFASITDNVFSRVFVDRVLGGESPEWLMPLIALMAAVAAAQIVVGVLNAVYLLRIRGKLATSSSATFMWHLLRLPMDFYQQRMVGDLQQRLNANESIAFTLVSQLAPVLLNALLLIFYLVVMIRYSLVLTAVGLTAMLVNLFVIRYISKRRVNIMRAQTRDAGKLYAATVSGVELIETIKAAGAETGYFQQWAGYQAAVNDSKVRFARLNQYLGMVPGIVSQAANIVVLLLGAWLIMDGHFSVGMLTAFQGFLGSFFQPVNDLLTLGQNMQEMRTQMERVQDVMNYPTDVEIDQQETEKPEKLKGAVQLENVSFGYSRFGKPVISDFSLNIESGQWVALVGGSGSGKSTISKLIAGLYQPQQGEIRFDGMPFDEVPYATLRSSLSVVDQDIVLFEDTVADNIRLWDPEVTHEQIVEAAKAACLHDDVMARPDGYEAPVLPGGSNFSGGQRQRIELARALAQQPSILILDEATSALDAQTEAEVIKNVRTRGITCIVVAHRLSTVRDCDQIVVLDGGRAVERGTHEELMNLDGAYAELVRNA